MICAGFFNYKYISENKFIRAIKIPNYVEISSNIAKSKSLNILVSIFFRFVFLVQFLNIPAKLSFP